MWVKRYGVGILKCCVFIVSLLPFALLLNGALENNLGANPIQTLHFETGDWALRFLWITLALTPLRRLSGWRVLSRFRRMMGLFAFFYASLHMLVFFVLDQALSWEQIKDEVPESPYVLVGLLAYVLLIPLALTSTQGMMRRLGRNWKRLHGLVYWIAILVLLHYFWLLKSDLSEWVIYALILLLLLLMRRFKDLPFMHQLQHKPRQTGPESLS